MVAPAGAEGTDSLRRGLCDAKRRARVLNWAMDIVASEHGAVCTHARAISLPSLRAPPRSPSLSESCGPLQFERVVYRIRTNVEGAQHAKTRDIYRRSCPDRAQPGPRLGEQLLGWSPGTGIEPDLAVRLLYGRS